MRETVPQVRLAPLDTAIPLLSPRDKDLISSLDRVAPPLRWGKEGREKVS